MSKSNLKNLILEVHQSHKKGKNIIETIRKRYDLKKINSTLPILLSYDLQAGQYNKNKSAKLKNFYDEYGFQLAEILNQYSGPKQSFLEVGCGECTSMESILKYLGKDYSSIYGFDVSWSRVYEGKTQIKKNKRTELFVSDLFSIPFKDNSIDIVYSSHSLEPNGGREEEAIKELVRVARDKVILFEPIYELATKNQKIRMVKHNYIRNLKKIINKLKYNVLEYRLLPIFSNPLNQSGLIVIEKRKLGMISKNQNIWQCPVTDKPLKKYNDLFYNEKIGLAYPILKTIPLLSSEHLIIASKLKKILT